MTCAGSKLFSFGSNSLGQLSLGHVIDASRPSIVSYLTTLSDRTISKIVAGGNHTFIVLESANDQNQNLVELYCAGDNGGGQCGLGVKDNSASAIFQPVAHPDDIHGWKNVSAGWQFSIFIGSDDNMYVCGVGNKGELGLGESITKAGVLTKIAEFPPPDTTVLELHSSVGHTVALLSDGRIFGWGQGRKGQLGSPNDAIVWSPREIALPEDFIAADITCGRLFTVIISRYGKVVVFGDDKWGVIAQKPDRLLGNWKSVHASWGSIYVLLKDGSVVAWGRNTHGQLPPNGLPPLKMLAVGSEHAIGVSQGNVGDLYAWGWGEHGNCGEYTDTSEEVVWHVKKIELNSVPLNAEDTRMSIRGVGAGCATSWLWID